MIQAQELEQAITAKLEGHPWEKLVHVVDTVDSTNTLLRTMAEEGAPQGTCLIALEQTQGRGRQGRSFSSPKGTGLYFSLLLRPVCTPAETGHVTAMAAVAACDAIETLSGLRPGIKWVNDLVLENKKLAGILTEMDADWTSNTINYIIVGIGINLNQKSGDFPPELENTAISLRMISRKETQLSDMATALILRFSQMSSSLITKKALWISRYRKNCITLGREIKIIRGDSLRYGWALDIDEDGGLLVRYTDGETGTVSAGEVSVRGLWGYV